MKTKTYDFEQHSEAWYEIKIGKISGSRIGRLMTKGRGNAPSKTRETELFQIASEVYTGIVSDEKTKNLNSIHIDRGNLYEPEARHIYELKTGNDVSQVGFIELDPLTGCSPDGLIVGKNGIIEIKCKDTHTFMKAVLLGISAIEPNDLKQIHFNMYIADADYCDYIIYNHNYEPEDSIYIQRIEKDLEMRKQIVEEIKRSKKDIFSMIEGFKEKITNNVD
jgi:hypothetical protein